jgi:hypothetical protein
MYRVERSIALHTCNSRPGLFPKLQHRRKRKKVGGITSPREKGDLLSCSSFTAPADGSSDGPCTSVDEADSLWQSDCRGLWASSPIWKTSALSLLEQDVFLVTETIINQIPTHPDLRIQAGLASSAFYAAGTGTSSMLHYMFLITLLDTHKPPKL